MGNDFHSGVSRIIHFLPSKHLIFDFKRFRYVLIPGKLLYQAREHLLCLPVNVGYGNYSAYKGVGVPTPLFSRRLS